MTAAPAHTARWRTCPGCGQALRLPPVPAGHRARCPRCGVRVRSGGASDARQRTAALAIAALVLYPPAMLLPVMRVERFGHVTEAGILDGAAALLASGQWIVGGVVFVCSVLLPLLKLTGLLVLALGVPRLAWSHRARTWRLIEWTGRWGMLDVLLVAVLVAALKLGDVLSVTAGPGAVAFCACVLLSLAAAAAFDPHQLWETAP